jgi:hypothetical protein
VIIIAVLCAGVYAYWVSLPLPKTVGPSVSITSPPLELSVSLDKTEYVTSDNITLGFSLRNISNDTITVGRTYAVAGPTQIDPTFRLTTSAEGVSTPGDPNMLGRRFYFGLTLVGSNGTIEQMPGIRLWELYTILIGPGGCLNQTLSISLPGLWGQMVEVQPSRTGVFQIRGSFPDFYLEGAGPTVTLETPSIAFTIN